MLGIKDMKEKLTDPPKQAAGIAVIALFVALIALGFAVSKGKGK